MSYTIGERIAAYREDMQRLDAKGKPGPALDAYNRMNAEAHRLGRDLTALNPYLEDEAERFFSRIIRGADGHAYWHLGVGRGRTGPSFELNDGRGQAPGRWWWEHETGATLTINDVIRPTCGALNCINPTHAQCSPRSSRRFSDQHMLGKLQVVALRLGHAPSTVEWRRGGHEPTDSVYYLRFGSWTAALQAAGLTPRPHQATPNAVTAADCLKSIRRARHILNRWPTTLDFERLSPQLRAVGLPGNPKTIKKYCGGTWDAALKLAGKVA